jgi:FdhD protein
MSLKASRKVIQWSETGGYLAVSDQVARECPVALVYNGISFAVMMASPESLEEFAYGFSLSEGVIESLDDIFGIDVVPKDFELVKGYSIDIEISARTAQRLSENRRALAGRTGCGICGIESIEKAVRPVKQVKSGPNLNPKSIDRAVKTLDQYQVLQLETGGAHAAAWCDLEGEILKVFEDVGRHNAMDKLLGYLASHRISTRIGFVLMSSRGSYEIVQKAAALGVANLVTVSAPSALACELASRSGINLVGFARPGREVIYTGSALE